MEFSILKEEEFSQFALHHPYASFFQTVPMAKMREQQGWKIHILGVKINGAIAAGSIFVSIPVFMGYSYVLSIRGYLIDYADKELLRFFHAHAISYFKRQKALYLKIDPYVEYKQRDHNAQYVKDGFDHSYVIDHLKELGYLHQGFTIGFPDDSQARFMSSIPIEGRTLQEVEKDMSQLTRRSIRKAEKSHLFMRELSYEELPQFKKVLEHTASRCGFEDRDMEYYQTMYQLLHKEGMVHFYLAEMKVDAYAAALSKEIESEQKKLLQFEAALSKNPDHPKTLHKKQACEDMYASLKKRFEEAKKIQEKEGNELILGAAMFITYGPEVIYLYGGAYDEYMHFNAQYFLQHQMLAYAIKHGYKVYNFYGLSGDFSKNSDDYGVFEFKRGFHANINELVGDFIYPVAKGRYRLYQLLKTVKQRLRG